MTGNQFSDFQIAFVCGDIELKGQFMLGSNYTFLVDVKHEGKTFPAVYKPSKGEQPLWDFETNTLALRGFASLGMVGTSCWVP